MEKLIELLNEYEGDTFVSIKWDEDHFKDDYFKNYERKIISKRYGFIKWLVDHDKIDRHSKKLELDMKRMRIPQDYYIGGLQSLDLQHKKAQYLSLIALLSIQDNPIEFLVSILK